jgi:hypothetical protein
MIGIPGNSPIPHYPAFPALQMSGPGNQVSCDFPHLSHFLNDTTHELIVSHVDLVASNKNPQRPWLSSLASVTLSGLSY